MTCLGYANDLLFANVSRAWDGRKGLARHGKASYGSAWDKGRLIKASRKISHRFLFFPTTTLMRRFPSPGLFYAGMISHHTLKTLCSFLLPPGPQSVFRRRRINKRYFLARLAGFQRRQRRRALKRYKRWLRNATPRQHCHQSKPAQPYHFTSHPGRQNRDFQHCSDESSIAIRICSSRRTASLASASYRAASALAC